MFQRALQALESDSRRSSLITAVVGVALAASWIAWLFWGSLPTYAVSSQARVEVVPAPFPVQAPVRGRLVAIHATIGDEVAAGALLFELDSVPEQLKLKAAKRRKAALDIELAALKRQAGAEDDAAAGQREEAKLGGLQAEARLREVRAAEEFLDTNARRMTTLEKQGAITDLEKQKATSDLKQLVESRRSSQIEIARKKQEMRVSHADRQADLAEIEHKIAFQEGLYAGLEVEIEELDREIERRMIRAPSAGRVGDLAKIQQGAWVEAGDRLAWVVPAGSFHVVAEFKPDAALGRVRSGLRSRVHLDGFPWTQFGMLEGHVLRVGSEVRDGLIRVDLSIETVNPVIPLQHGLPGVAEVMVESSSPAEQILRSLGR